MVNKKYILIFGNLLFFIIFSLLAFLSIENQLINSIDEYIVRLLSENRITVLDNLFLIISWFGSRYFMIIASIIVISGLFLTQKIQKSILFLIAMLTTTASIIITKEIFQRSRPQIDSIIIEETFSFPSGHATAAVVFFGLILINEVIETKSKGRKIITSIFIIMTILLISISRIYLGVHYPTDILGGVILGGWIIFNIVARNNIIR